MGGGHASHMESIFFEVDGSRSARHRSQDTETAGTSAFFHRIQQEVTNALALKCRSNGQVRNMPYLLILFIQFDNTDHLVFFIHRHEMLTDRLVIIFLGTLWEA